MIDYPTVLVGINVKHTNDILENFFARKFI